MNTYELLVGARDVFARRGGVKNELEDDNGNVCALGAINVALTGKATWSWGGFSEDIYLFDEVSTLLTEAINGDIITYNNRSDVTKEDVLAVYDKAIAGLEEKA